MSFLTQYDDVGNTRNQKEPFVMGIVSYTENNKAYIKIQGSKEPIQRGALIPKNMQVFSGEKVLVGFIGGAWWVLNVY